MNLNIGNIRDLHLTVIYQNGGFTKVWLSLKTIFFPFIVAIMCWFWNRVHQLQRAPVIIEYMLLCLGGALTFLNRKLNSSSICTMFMDTHFGTPEIFLCFFFFSSVPLEYLTLMFDMPFMPLLGDIRQGIFYAQLLSFWLIFAGEHMLIQDGASTLKTYWKHLSAVVIGCISLFAFDVCERGAQLRNPFYSIWMTKIGANIAVCTTECKTYALLPIVNVFDLFFPFSSHSSYSLEFRHAFTFSFCAIWFGAYSATLVSNDHPCHRCLWPDVFTMKASSIDLNFWCWLHYCAQH